MEDTIVEHSTLMTYYFAKILPFGNRFHVFSIVVMVVSFGSMEQDAVESHSTVFFLGTVIKFLDLPETLNPYKLVQTSQMKFSSIMEPFVVTLLTTKSPSTIRTGVMIQVKP